jgi:hypothetical protein
MSFGSPATGKRAKVARFLGRVLDAHLHPDLAEQERERALQRAVIAFAVSGVWLVKYLLGEDVQASTWFVVFICLLGGMALVHRYALKFKATAAFMASTCSWSWTQSSSSAYWCKTLKPSPSSTRS